MGSALRDLDPFWTGPAAFSGSFHYVLQYKEQAQPAALLQPSTLAKPLQPAAHRLRPARPGVLPAAGAHIGAQASTIPAIGGCDREWRLHQTSHPMIDSQPFNNFYILLVIFIFSGSRALAGRTI